MLVYPTIMSRGIKVIPYGLRMTLATGYSRPSGLVVVMVNCFLSSGVLTSFSFDDGNDLIGVVGVDRGSVFVDFEKPKANEGFERFFRESAFPSGKIHERRLEGRGELVGDFLGCHG